MKEKEEKANPVLVRLGFSDKIITKNELSASNITQDDSFIVGYEDEDGRECDEEGNYLN